MILLFVIYLILSGYKKMHTNLDNAVNLSLSRHLKTELIRRYTKIYGHVNSLLILSIDVKLNNAS